MCYFKDIERVESINEIQAAIIRTIARKREPFDCKSMIEEVKDELRHLGLDESIVESYRVDNMIRDTLEQMVDIGNITFFNNMYKPIQNTEKRIKYAFA